MDKFMSTLEDATKLSGATLKGILIGTLIVALLLIIASWKIFTKAGYAGWKSLIPIYNVYIFCKIINISFWIWIIILPVLVGVASAIFKETVAAIISSVYSIILEVMIASRLAKAFDKGLGFTLGLIFLPSLFTLILGFGKSKYVGVK